MTLKEELEILRGEPIKVCTGDPLDIPTIETSDPERLCKQPVVSVNMITYNHEPYIRQAIEGVMMQKTDFEFELVIGEDCSTDRTREICFEYQKRYPDKIRVLWWHENLRKVNHPAGYNGARTRARCRGEFIAFCEGDDYWIDPLKLQKQVDVMRKYPNVGIASGKHLHLTSSGYVFSRRDVKIPEGLIAGKKAFLWLLYGMNPVHAREQQIHTSTILVRRAILNRMNAEFSDLFRCALSLGDLQMFLGATALSDLYMIGDPISMYRTGGGGVMTYPLSSTRVRRDGMLVTLYFTKRVLGFDVSDIPSFQLDELLMTSLKVHCLNENTKREIQEYWEQCLSVPDLHFVRTSARYRALNKLIRKGKCNLILSSDDIWSVIKFYHGETMSDRLREYYVQNANDEYIENSSDRNQTFEHRAVMRVRSWYVFFRSWLRYHKSMVKGK